MNNTKIIKKMSNKANKSKGKEAKLTLNRSHVEEENTGITIQQI